MGKQLEINSVPAFDEMHKHPITCSTSDVTIFEQLPFALSMQGVIFTDLFTAMLNHSELVEEYFNDKKPFRWMKIKWPLPHLRF